MKYCNKCRSVELTWAERCAPNQLLFGYHRLPVRFVRSRSFKVIDLTLCLKKVPTFKLSVTLSNLNRFSECLHCWKFATKPIQHFPPHLRHVATLPWEIKKSFLQIFSRYGRKCKQILIFSVFKIASLSPHWWQIKFSMSLLLLIYFCDQFVVPEIRHSGRHCSVCQQSTWYSAMRTIFWLKKVCIWIGTQQIGWQTTFLRKAGQSMVLISCWKSCETQAQLTEPPNATTQQLALFSYQKITCLCVIHILNIVLTHKYTQHTQLHA